MPSLWTVRDVAEYLQVGVKRVYDLAESRDPEIRLPAVRIGRQLRFLAEEVEQWVVNLNR